MANGLLAKNGLIVTGSVEVQNAVTASTFSGDGSGLSGVSDFPYTGSAVISGSLDIKGDTSITGSTYIKGAIWARGTNSIIYLGSQYSALQIKTGGIYLGGTANNGGNNGVSIGNNAGRFATGNNNALIGNQAGYRAAYSNGYVAVGKNSNSGDGAYNKDNSVGIGIGSNYNGSTNTVAVGGYSGNYSSNTPYTSSVFIGTSAGTKGGSNSVYVGHQSRGEGIGNTALGYQTGLYSSGSNNLFLGYQAGYNLTGSNQLIIANNSSSVLVTGDFANNTFNISGSVSASTYYGDGSNLTGIETDPFPYTGSAVISGSLEVIGDTTTNGSTTITGSNSLAGNYALKVTNTSGDNILNVENDGNVGLGLADPSYKLQVRGDTNDSTDYPFRVEDSSGTPLFRVRSDGYVMFGNLGENLAIDFTGGNRYLKFFNSSISAQGGTGISATGTIGFTPGTGTSNKITFIHGGDAYGSVHLAQGTAANTTFPNDRGTEILFNREVNHQKHYGVIRGDDNQYQPVPIYIFSGQHTSTSVNQPLILQNLPGGASRGNVGIGLEDPQTNLHVSGAVSASTYYGDGSNLTGIDSSDFSNLPTSDPSIAGRLFQTSSEAIGASAGFQVVLISQG